MSAAKNPQDNLSQAGQNLIRVIIASYFIAVSIGLISGTDATPLAAMFLTGETAQFVGSSVIFILAYLVMTGIFLRAAAMVLGLIMFWSSYMLNIGSGNPMALGEFWRDLTLVAALMLTYVRTQPRASRGRAMIRWSPRARRVGTDTKIMPRRVSAKRPSNITRLPVSANKPEPKTETANIFLDEAKDVAAS